MLCNPEADGFPPAGFGYQDGHPPVLPLRLWLSENCSTELSRVLTAGKLLYVSFQVLSH